MLLVRLRLMRRWRSRNKRREFCLFPGYVFVHPGAGRQNEKRHMNGACGLTFKMQEPAAKTRRGLEAFKLLMRSGAALADRPKLGRKM
jgi:hypothetical protein